MNLVDFENLKLIAQDAMSDGYWQKANDIWILLNKEFPGRVCTWLGLAQTQIELKQWNAAESLLEKATLSFPDNVDILIQLAETYYLQGKYDQTRILLDKASQNFPSNLALELLRLRILIDEKNFEEAETFAEYLIKYFPNNYEIIKISAELAAYRQDWREANKRWATYRSKFPNDYVGIEEGARCLRKLGRLQDARKLLLSYEYGEEWLKEVNDDKHSYLLAIPERRNLSNNFNLIITKALFNLKSEASRNKLSYLWWIIEPILYMLIFYIVFTFILDRGGDNYVIVLLTGMVPFTWFGKGIQVSSTSILYGRNILENVKISAMFFPAVSVVQTTIKEMPVFLVFLIFLIYYQIYPTIEWLELFPVLILEAILIFSFGLFCSMFIPFLKDLQQIVPTFIQFLLFTSGVFYDISVIPEEYQKTFLLNPMANVIYQHRLVIIDGQGLDWHFMGILFVEVAVILVVTLLLFYILRERFLKAIMS